MAYYEMMPAGLPAGLQSGMDSVLNKKFGTSTSYAPGTWPDTVNLLGPLPEKTIISSPIVDFQDGADDVPIKSLVVTIPPTLTGTSLVTETQTGRNIMPNEKVQGASTRVNIGQTDDDYSLHLKAGTYTLSATSLVQMRAYYRTSTGGSNVLIWSKYDTNGSGTFTLSEDSDVRIWLYNGDGLSVSDIQTFQLEVGSTAHDYEPYNPTTYTASLGRTIYGGQVDIVNGTGTDENGNDFTFTGQEIPTTLGYNAFWSDQGDTEVTYRADINLALGGN